jgi:hypothetical protein
MIRSIATSAILLSISRLAIAAEPVRVELRSMTDEGRAYVGQQVVTRGCLVSALPHAMFLRPCGDARSDILLVEMPVNLVPDDVLLMSADIEIDLIGTLALERNGDGSGSHLLLRVDRVANAVRRDR